MTVRFKTRSLVFLFSPLLISFHAGLAHAQETKDSIGGSVEDHISVPAEEEEPSDAYKGPRFGPFQLTAYWKSDATLARQSQIVLPEAQKYDWANDYMLGVKHKSGWGFGGIYSTANDGYNDQSRNVNVVSDPSVLLFHPTLIKAESFKLNGYVEVKLPASDDSKLTQKTDYRYWSILDGELPRKLSYQNLMTAHYFQQSRFAADDTHVLIDDQTYLQYSVTQWFAPGIGQETQVETHDQTASGTRTDLLAIAEFDWKNLSFDALAYLPLNAVNTVRNEAGTVALNQFQTEFILKAAF